MSGEEWLFTAAVLILGALSLVSQRLAYKHGIWDGAFNQFLPYVRKSMLEYDERRGRQILEQEEEPIDFGGPSLVQPPPPKVVHVYHHGAVE